MKMREVVGCVDVLRWVGWRNAPGRRLSSAPVTGAVRIPECGGQIDAGGIDVVGVGVSRIASAWLMELVRSSN